MNTVSMIVDGATKFYTELKLDEHGRYKSWEHCYYNFYKARNNPNADIDYLSLQLAFYLASWGMYRGSSFLLQKDYRIHTPIIEELLKSDYDPLFGIDCIEIKKENNKELLMRLSKFIEDYYDGVRKEVKANQEIKNQLSGTLITKILMGTMGCVPAYDRYFIDGIKTHKVASGNYNMNSILMLVDFYEKNMDAFEIARCNMSVEGLPYPQMKLLDMGFWKIGFDKDVK